jgi:hypothetical protein
MTKNNLPAFTIAFFAFTAVVALGSSISGEAMHSHPAADTSCSYKCNGATEGGTHEPSRPTDSTPAADCAAIPAQAKTCQQDNVWFSEGARYWFNDQCNECLGNSSWFKRDDGDCERRQSCSSGKWFLLDIDGRTLAKRSPQSLKSQTAKESAATRCTKAGEFCVNRETSSGVCHAQEATERPQLGTDLLGPFSSRKEATTAMCNALDDGSPDPGKCAAVAPQGACDKRKRPAKSKQSSEQSNK